jgi:threonine aldolase
MKTIDLRSDTITRPTPAMREAMLNAEVGDDVFGEDPTVNSLQERVASMFGKESALFVPSGVMGNQICVKCHTEPGDEIIAGEDSHVVVYETGAPGLLSGVLIRTIPETNAYLDPSRVAEAVRPDQYYYPRTRLVCIENTHGRSGGTVYPLEQLHELWLLTREREIRLHMDGARIWNASAASGVPLEAYARHADTISVCFSKGLGAPVGSMILSDRKTIERAKKYRKIFGGGMRQVGLLAACAMYALDNHLPRLGEDHEKAKVFASELTRGGKISINPSSIETNMVIFDISHTGRSQESLLIHLAKAGVLLTPERGTHLRAVTHMDVTMEEVRSAAARISEAL